MKKTKIICSIGPSTQKWENFKGLVDAGTQITNLVTKAGLLRTAFMGALGVAGAKGKLGRANYQLSSCTMPRAI